MRAARDLTDADLVRLARLGGSVERIAEAAGIDRAEARRRLAAVTASAVAAAGEPAVKGRTSMGADPVLGSLGGAVGLVEV